MLKLKIELSGTNSSRVVIIPKECTLEGLHEVIQRLFFWDGSHPWAFSGKNDVRWELPSDSLMRLFGPEPKDPCTTCVGTVLTKKGSHLYYVYDFGDNWHHRITRMTDPKDGATYGCVKTTGPDGIDDCGGPFGLAEEETYEPTLDEVNQRLPKKVRTGVYTPPICVDRPEDLTLRDVVNSKDMDVLRQVAEHEKKLPSREECVERTVRLINEHHEPLKLFLFGLVDQHYKIAVDALMKGVGCLDFPAAYEVGLFEGFPYVYVDQCGRNRYKIIAPKELRVIWQKHCMEWGMLHSRWNEIQQFASAAVRLYGTITVHDFIALLEKYDVPGPHSEELITYILDVRSYSGYACHIVSGNELRWDDFNEDDDEGAEMYSDFLKKRRDVPRCETLTREEFIAYADDEYVEDVESVRTVLSFIEKRIREAMLPRFILREIVDQLGCGEEPGEIVAQFNEYSFPDKAKYFDKFAKMIEDMRSNIRLPIYNGYTYQELRLKA